MPDDDGALPTPYLVSIACGVVESIRNTVALRPREREIVTYLAAHGKLVERDRLLDAIFDDLGTPARNQLKVYISRIRALLGSSAITTSANGYALGPHITTDLVDIDRLLSYTPLDDWSMAALVAHSERMNRHTRPAWRWYGFIEDRVQESELRVHRFLAEDALNRADLPDALRYARRAIAVDTFDQSARRALVRTYLALGDRSSAKREIDTFARLLSAELREGISADLRALRENIES